MSQLGTQDAEVGLEQPLILDDDSDKPFFTCTHCKCTSCFELGFQPQPNEENQTARYICNTCEAYEKQKKGRKTDQIKFVLLAAFTAFILVDDGIASFAVFLFQWFFVLHITIFIHELGHFLGAYCVGVKIRMMVLGGGPLLKAIRLGQMMLVVKALPQGGSVHPEFESAAHARKKLFLIVLAGPMSNFIAAGILAIAIMLFRGSFPPPINIFITFLALMNVFVGLSNLIPFNFIRGSIAMLSDGAILFSLRKTSDEDIDKLVQANKSLVAQTELLHGDKRIAKAISIDAIESGQGDLAYGGILTNIAFTHEETAQAIEMNRRVLRDINADDETTAMIRNNLAFSIYLNDDPANLDEADEQSQKAFDLLPMVLAVRSTRGAVLTAMGHLDLGLELLEDERFALESPENQATVMCIRAKAYREMGLHEKASKYLNMAKNLDPENKLLQSTRLHAVHSTDAVKIF